MVSSLLSCNTLTKARIDRMHLLLAGKSVTYKEIDLGTEAYPLELWQRTNLPVLFVHGVFIGGTDHVQTLEDSGLLEPVLLQEFLFKCLMCGAARYSSSHCLFCWRPYLFFTEQEKQVHTPTVPPVANPRKRSL